MELKKYLVTLNDVPLDGSPKEIIAFGSVDSVEEGALWQCANMPDDGTDVAYIIWKPELSTQI